MKKMIFRGPVMTASGYGVHARMILKALIDSGQYDITVMSVPWGATPLLYEDDPFLNTVRDLSNRFNPNDPGQFDISVQVTIPNEFMKMAPINIGITAGIETDRVSTKWIEKVNETVDLLIVPSRHSADAFNAVGGLQKPMYIVPEWVDTSVYNTVPLDEKSEFDFPSKFNYLAVGLGLDKADGEDRKNFTLLVKWFCEQFRNNPDVGLVLKLSMVNYSPVDYQNVCNRLDYIKKVAGCGEFPRIHLIHGRLSDRKLAALYKHPQIKALVTLTHGEGYGLPIIEAAACGLPVVATNWSGHLDFLNIGGVNKFVPVAYELKEIPQSAVWKGVLEAGTKWAYPDETDAKKKMTKLVLSYDKPREWASELAVHIADRYSERLGDQFAQFLYNFLNLQKQEQTLEPIITKPTTNPQYDQFLAFVKDRRNYYRGGYEGKTLIYTMPGSAGDVFVSTAVVNSLKKKYPDHRIFFATNAAKYSDILKNNPDIFAVIHFEEWMNNTRLLEFIFDEVYTPNFPVQVAQNNWIGKGRKLVEQFANHCNVDVGECFIDEEIVAGVPMSYIVFHPGAGVGQWGARDYKRWQEVIDELNKLGTPIVQVGAADDRKYAGVIDLRGKTNYNQLAYVVKKAELLVGIDSFPMHLAADYFVPHVNIFGSSTPKSTSPETRGCPAVYLETPDRGQCTKPCYLNECIYDPANPCINAINPNEIVDAVKVLLAL